MIRAQRKINALALALAVLNPWFARVHAADDLTVLIQPVHGEEHAKKEFRPLCEYLAKIANRSCRILTPPTFVAYWGILRRGDYDLALDAPHFTDYRIRKMGFSVLAQVGGSISYTLIVADTGHNTDPAELVGQRVATLGPLSIGAARLGMLYPNPVRQPVIIEVASAEEGVQLLKQKKVAAAVLPTGLVGRWLTQGGIAVVLTTEPSPHLALSASPRLAPDMQEKIRAALLHAGGTNAGKSMLEDIGVERFDPTSAEAFANQGNVLKSYWGY